MWQFAGFSPEMQSGMFACFLKCRVGDPDCVVDCECQWQEPLMRHYCGRFAKVHGYKNCFRWAGNEHRVDIGNMLPLCHALWTIFSKLAPKMRRKLGAGNELHCEISSLSHCRPVTRGSRSILRIWRWATVVYYVIQIPESLNPWIYRNGFPWYIYYWQLLECLESFSLFWFFQPF